MYIFSFIVGSIIPKSVKCIHSATKVNSQEQLPSSSPQLHPRPAQGQCGRHATSWRWLKRNGPAALDHWTGILGESSFTCIENIGGLNNFNNRNRVFGAHYNYYDYNREPPK